MKNKVLAIMALALILISGCKKEDNWAEKWVGTYDKNTGSGEVQRVVITEVDAKTLRLDLKTMFLGTYITYATIANGELTSENTLIVDEDGFVGNSTDTYRLTGSGSLNGAQLTITGQAVNKTDPTEAPTPYYFSGNR